jgi:NagD protein
MRIMHGPPRAYVIGESGLTEAIHDIAYIITDHDPHFVVLGETGFSSIVTILSKSI